MGISTGVERTLQTYKSAVKKPQPNKKKLKKYLLKIPA